MQVSAHEYSFTQVGSTTMQVSAHEYSFTQVGPTTMQVSTLSKKNATRMFCNEMKTLVYMVKIHGQKSEIIGRHKQGIGGLLLRGIYRDFVI